MFDRFRIGRAGLLPYAVFAVAYLIIWLVLLVPDGLRPAVVAPGQTTPAALMTPAAAALLNP